MSLALEIPTEPYPFPPGRNRELKSTGPDLTWYVCHTNARAEAMASAALRQAGYQTLFLHYPGQTTHARKVRDVIRPYFPRYLFVAVEPGQGLYGVNKGLGVSTVLFCDDQPLVVPRAVIDELVARANPEGLVLGMGSGEKRKRRRFRHGQAIHIDGGPFKGFVGQVELDSGREVKVWVQDLNRRMRVSFCPETLSPV